MVTNNLSTPEGLLRELLRVNSKGVWFFKDQKDDKYVSLPTWLWAYCKQALPDALILGSEEYVPPTSEEMSDENKSIKPTDDKGDS
jgi:hypothetical protein